MATYDTKVTNGISLGYKHVAVTADDTAGELIIDFNIPKVLACIVQILRAGVDVTGDAVITFPANGQVKVEDGSTYAITADDVIVIVGNPVPL